MADHWPLFDGLMLLVDYGMNFKPYTFKDDDEITHGDPFVDRQAIYNRFQCLLIDDIERQRIKLIRIGFNTTAYLDPITKEEYQVKTSYVKPVELLQWAVIRKIAIPEELKHLIHDEVSEEQRKDELFIDECDAEFEKKYPKFVDLDINSPNKATLQSLKQKYAMLRTDAYKWKIGIYIALRVGLLYHRKGLSKQVSEGAFLKTYKNEFDGILKNDTMAKLIYEYLPESYTKGDGSPKQTTDIDIFIKAAALAGYLSGSHDISTVDCFKKALAREKFAVPDDIMLQKIIVAAQELEDTEDE
jgi:hypothetical protein